MFAVTADSNLDNTLGAFLLGVVIAAVYVLYIADRES